MRQQCTIGVEKLHESIGTAQVPGRDIAKRLAFDNPVVAGFCRRLLLIGAAGRSRLLAMSFPGVTAACWPGQRLNRNHGICKDGTTVCQDTGEFGLRWGKCEGYVLPDENALSGPEACGCFSNGNWSLDNLSPCIFRGNIFLAFSLTLSEKR